MLSTGFSPDGTARIWDVTWATLVRGDALLERVCTEKLVGSAQEFIDETRSCAASPWSVNHAAGAGRYRSTIGRGCQYNSGVPWVQMSL